MTRLASATSSITSASGDAAAEATASNANHGRDTRRAAFRAATPSARPVRNGYIPKIIKTAVPDNANTIAGARASRPHRPSPRAANPPDSKPAEAIASGVIPTTDAAG